MAEVHSAIQTAKEEYRKVGGLLLDWVDSGETDFSTPLILEIAGHISKGAILSAEAVTLISEMIR
jgi:hypothetical protein